MSADTRGAISCWTPTENSQLYMRWPQPVRRSESKMAPGPSVPNAVFVSLPHSRFAFGLIRSQSGMKFVLLSVQLRVVEPMTLFTAAGVMTRPVCTWTSPCRYLLIDPLTAVFPVPNKSYTAESFGVTSFNERFGCSGNERLRVGASG